VRDPCRSRQDVLVLNLVAATLFNGGDELAQLLSFRACNRP
jgi:hypothetical protein